MRDFCSLHQPEKLVIENNFDVAVAAREILAIAFSTLRSKVIERTRPNANRVIAKAVLMRFPYSIDGVGNGLVETS